MIVLVFPHSHLQYQATLLSLFSPLRITVHLPNFFPVKSKPLTVILITSHSNPHLFFIGREVGASFSLRRASLYLYYTTSRVYLLSCIVSCSICFEDEFSHSSLTISY